MIHCISPSNVKNVKRNKGEWQIFQGEVGERLMGTSLISEIIVFNVKCL